MRTQRFRHSGFSTIRITAALCVVGLLGVSAWEIESALHPAVAPAIATSGSLAVGTESNTPLPKVNWQLNPSGTSTVAVASSTDPDGLANIAPNVVGTLLGSYSALQNAGQYSSDVGGQIAGDVASTLVANVSYSTFTASDIKTDSDTSLARMLTYRADMRTATAPLLKNKEPEYAIFARYVDSQNPKDLAELQTVAKNYRDSVALLQKVVVPADATTYHVAIMNSLSSFAATLDAMSAHANDPFASAALLRTYDAAEQDVLTSFNDEAMFYRKKVS